MTIYWVQNVMTSNVKAEKSLFGRKEYVHIISHHTLSIFVKLDYANLKASK